MTGERRGAWDRADRAVGGEGGAGDEGVLRHRLQGEVRAGSAAERSKVFAGTADGKQTSK